MFATNNKSCTKKDALKGISTPGSFFKRNDFKKISKVDTTSVLLTERVSSINKVGS